MYLLANITEQHYSEPELAGMPGGWLRLLGLLILGLLAYAVFWMYRREARVGAPPSLRNWLACVRFAVILLLAVIWLEPVIATYTIRAVTALTVVLVDTSRSMSITDAEAGPESRIERVAELLDDDNQKWLRALAERNDISLYTFGETTSRVSVTLSDAGADVTATDAAGSTGDLTLNAVGSQTDFGQSLTAALADAGDRPIAGIVVISDGVFNAGMSADDAAAYAERSRTPLYVIGAGASHEPANLRIAGFSIPPMIPVGDPVEIRADVSSTGVDPTTVTLELTVRPADSDPSEQRALESRNVEIGSDAENEPIRFQIDADQPGEFVYAVRMAALPQEAVESDNFREAPVLVLDERLRVLVVSGRPSYEYRYLTRLLERDKTINLSCWLQSADTRAVRDGDTVITELPRRPEEIFEYDAILLLDPDPSELDSSWAITVRRLVDEFGGGLLLQAGPHFTGRLLRDARLSELISILPIVADPEADVRLSAQGAYRTHGSPFAVANEVLGHPVMRFSSDRETSRQIWEALPGAWWHLPTLREKPIATVLLRNGGPAHTTASGQPVLLATQPFGAGRTAFQAFDNTWRWRATGERYFNQYWVQLVRYLAQPRREGASKRGTIVLDRETVNPGDYVKVEVRVVDANYEPWHVPEIAARLEITGETARELRLRAIPDRPGWFAGRFVADWTGPAAIRVDPPAGGGQSRGADTPPDEARQEPRPPGAPRAPDEPRPPGEVVKHFQVQGSDIELAGLRQDSEALMTLANRTRGAYVTLADAASVPALIEDAREVKTTRGPDQPLWDRAWVLALLAALLAVEWTVRRRSHLL